MKITLCGSTRFKQDFSNFNAALSLGGHVVYALAMHGRQEKDVGKADDFPLITDADKMRLDLVHLAKIEESDAIVVINPGGYIGESTLREIAWAETRGKEVFYLDNCKIGVGVIGHTVWSIYDTASRHPLATFGARYLKSYL